MLLSVIIPVFNEEEIVAETYRVLEEELKDIALTADSEEVIDYLKRWNDVMEDIKKCELTPKQKAEVKELVTKIVVLGSLPIRSPDSF